VQAFVDFRVLEEVMILSVPSQSAPDFSRPAGTSTSSTGTTSVNSSGSPADWTPTSLWGPVVPSTTTTTTARR